MSRVAIGYKSNGESAERPSVAFFETIAGVVVYEREAMGPRLVKDTIGSARARPGEREYFDVVLDAFSASCLIRTVLDLEPNLIVTMIAKGGDALWDALPAPAQHALA